MYISSFLFSLDAKTAGMKLRDRSKVSTLFHGAGLVVPYNKKTEVDQGFHYYSLEQQRPIQIMINYFFYKTTFILLIGDVVL